MNLKLLGGTFALGMLAALSAPITANQAPARTAPRAGIVKGGDERTGAYDVVPGWWKPAPNHGTEWTWGQVAGVAADTPNRIIAVTTGDVPIKQTVPRTVRRTNLVVVADRNGNIVENWTQWDSVLTLPHQVYISPYDPERHVWVVDNGGADGQMQVLKFSNDGKKLVMRIGDPVHPKTREEARANPKPGPYTFGWPSKLEFLPDGSLYVADGYWNSRVVKYTADGKYVMEWGSLGKGPGQFDLLHGLAVDRDRRVYVGDRQNQRIQIFTPEGKFIEEWPNIFDPVTIHIDENEAVWVVDASLNRILKYNKNGELLYYWGAYGQAGAMGRGTWAGGLSLPHQLDVDDEGNVYVASYNGGWVNKFVPKPGADPAKLVGKKLKLPQ